MAQNENNAPLVEAEQNHPYTKGKAIDLGASTIAGGGGTSAVDLVTAGYQWLTCFAKLGNATTPAGAAGDVGLGVSAYEDDGVTQTIVWMTNDLNVANASLNSGIAYIGRRYNLAGIDKVRIFLQNNNAGALQGGRVVYYLQK